jgi:hypothetical protein
MKSINWTTTSQTPSAFIFLGRYHPRKEGWPARWPKHFFARPCGQLVGHDAALHIDFLARSGQLVGHQLCRLPCSHQEFVAAAVVHKRTTASNPFFENKSRHCHPNDENAPARAMQDQFRSIMLLLFAF